MWVFNKNFENINEQDIQSLVNQEVSEQQSLEYKERSYGRSDEDTREMLRDIASMANAYGGYLIIGIREDNKGIPVEITGVENAEEEADRIQACCLSSIDPRIPVRVKPIPVKGKNPVIIIFIPRSTRAPHIITYKGLYQFWIRHDRQKSRMSVEEIRDAVLKTENIRKDIEEFIKDRKKEILEEIEGNPTYVIGAAPIMVKDDIIDISNGNIREMLRNPPDQVATPWNLNFRGNGSSSTPTIYGLKIEDGNRRIELFRNGYLELRVKINEPDRTILATPVVDYAVNFYRLLKGLVEYLGLNEPFVGFLNLYNIRGFHLRILRRGIKIFGLVEENSELSSPWNKPHLEIPPKQINSLDEPNRVAKDFVDRVWNAFGYDEVPSEMFQYREGGN